jgi:hypothetical protein
MHGKIDKDREKLNHMIDKKREVDSKFRSEGSYMPLSREPSLEGSIDNNDSKEKNMVSPLKFKNHSISNQVTERKHYNLI